MKVDQVMIGSILGDFELGIYSVAVRIAELWYFVPSTIVLALLPKLTSLFEKENKSEFYEYFQKCMSMLVLLGYVSVMVTTVFSRLIINILYGVEYLDAAPILCLYIWSGIFINMSVLRGNYFVLTEWTECSLWTNAMGAVINIVLNLFLINTIGKGGAVVATIISYGVYAYISSLAIPKLRKIGEIQTKSFVLKGLFHTRWNQ